MDPGTALLQAPGHSDTSGSNNRTWRTNKLWSSVMKNKLSRYTDGIWVTPLPQPTFSDCFFSQIICILVVLLYVCLGGYFMELGPSRRQVCSHMSLSSPVLCGEGLVWAVFWASGKSDCLTPAALPLTLLSPQPAATTTLIGQQQSTSRQTPHQQKDCDSLKAPMTVNIF